MLHVPRVLVAGTSPLFSSLQEQELETQTHSLPPLSQGVRHPFYLSLPTFSLHIHPRDLAGSSTEPCIPTCNSAIMKNIDASLHGGVFQELVGQNFTPMLQTNIFFSEQQTSALEDSIEIFTEFWAL